MPHQWLGCQSADAEVRQILSTQIEQILLNLDLLAHSEHLPGAIQCSLPGSHNANAAISASKSCPPSPSIW